MRSGRVKGQFKKETVDHSFMIDKEKEEKIHDKLCSDLWLQFEKQCSFEITN